MNKEDIKILEEMLENKETITKYHAWIGTNAIQSIEHLLQAYKEQVNLTLKTMESLNMVNKKCEEQEKVIDEIAKEIKKLIGVSDEDVKKYFINKVKGE